MTETWKKVAVYQRTSELIDMIDEQKGRDLEHKNREIKMEKKAAERSIELSRLIEILSKHMLDLDRRVSDLEKTLKPGC